MKKIILVFISLGLLSLVISPKALAQEHACMWVEHLPGVGSCEPTSSCPSGYHPQTTCGNFDINECNGSHPCEPNPTAECTCKIDSATNSCVETTPSRCDSGEKCQCQAEIEPSTGLVTFCYPGKCTATPPSKGENGEEEKGKKVQPELCPTDAGPETGIMTALGCIPTKDTSLFVAWLMKRAIGIGGGIAFLLMIFAGFQIITSSGDPQKLQAGKELFTSAIVGLILIIFSVFLLELIGVRIFNIPGLGQ